MGHTPRATHHYVNRLWKALALVVIRRSGGQNGALIVGRAAMDSPQSGPKARSTVDEYRNPWRVVGAAGIEPATPGLEIPCSIQLSYAPISTFSILISASSQPGKRVASRFMLLRGPVPHTCQDSSHVGKTADDARHGVIGMDFVFEIDEALIVCGD
jgi:hypothetical protein